MQLKTNYMFHTRIFGLLVTAALITSCGSETKNEQVTTDQTDSLKVVVDTSEVFKRTQAVFYSMPSPLELTTLIKQAEGNFRQDLLHDPGKANTYQSTQKKALALGLYGADLSYVSIHNQKSDALKYLAASKRLGEGIGIQEAFTAELIERANANLENRDSMMAIMTEMYWQTSSQLKEENRDQLALIVVSGGWVEGLYIGCNVYDNSQFQAEIIQRMAEQKFASSQLEAMFDSMNDDYMVADVEKTFEPLFEFFESLEMSQEETSVVNNENDGSITIGGSTNIKMTPEQFIRLKTIVNEIRAKIVEP